MQTVELLHKPCQSFAPNTHGHFPRLRRTVFHPGIEFPRLPFVQSHVINLEIIEEDLGHQGICGKGRTPDIGFRQTFRHVVRTLRYLLLTGQTTIHVKPPHAARLHVCDIMPHAISQPSVRRGIRARPVLDSVIPTRVARAVHQPYVLLRPMGKSVCPTIILQRSYAGQGDVDRHGIIGIQPGQGTACHVHA